MTITLDDVSCLLHVPIRGELVDPDVVVTDYDAIHLAVELFGVSLSDATTEASTVRGPYYKLDWLKQIFEQQRAANNFTGALRAYMMLLLGCTILADKTFTLVEAKYLPLFRDLSTCGRYCWGAAALGYWDKCKGTSIIFFSELQRLQFTSYIFAIPYFI
ncbi:protein MAIN-LIKE 1-like [Vicia villosa]|uniref:protein MAIN-LIKE 1-like n=1 Tax=Vicia villosa TaxID=3911 RepID=UPI00273CD234|nr:protein MAIN-LIKE 1-like [Vicia villosa]